MSYILDALRKAEQERQNQQQPGLHSMQSGRLAPEKNSSRWFWITAAVSLLVAVNLGIWLWQSRAPGEDTSSVQNDSADTGAEQRVAKNLRPSQEPRNAPRKAFTEPALPGSVASPPAEQAANAEPVDQRAVQELWQTAAHIKAAVQDLNFSFHVYSTNPERRTIIINNNRMREGTAITADLNLKEITKDGVILEHPETLIHIAILEQW